MLISFSSLFFCDSAFLINIKKHWFIIIINIKLQIKNNTLPCSRVYYYLFVFFHWLFLVQATVLLLAGGVGDEPVPVMSGLAAGARLAVGVL